MVSTTAGQQEPTMGKGKDKPSKQSKKPKSEKPKGAGSAYKQDKAAARKAKHTDLAPLASNLRLV